MILEQRRIKRTRPESRRLNNYRKNIHSQFGEDGILEQLISEIGLPQTGGWCVEFGAWDGVHLSNTCNLIRNRGYHSVMIEGDNQRYAELLNNHGENPRVHCISGIVSFDEDINTLDYFLGTTPIPREFDLLSIDIDSNDYYIWESLVNYSPRIVIIEINPTIPNDIVFVQDKNFGISQGCSLLALVELGKKKGYELACATKGNAIFVLERDYPALGLPSNAPDDMYEPISNAKLFQGYDGTLYNIGLTPQWQLRNMTIAPDQFQALEKKQRKFADHMAVKLELQMANEQNGSESRDSG